MAKAGRPKSEVRKEKIVSFRMTEEAYLRLKKYAELNHITISQAMQKGIDKLGK